MTRITDIQVARNLLNAINKNRLQMDRASNELSTGIKSPEPGDTKNGATISQLRNGLVRIDEQKLRAETVLSQLSFQDDILAEANDTLIRAKEVAAEAANETVSDVQRASMAEEIFALRDQIVSLANSKFGGRFIYAGAADDQPAFSPTTAFTNPASGPASVRYAYTTNSGNNLTRSVGVSDNLSVKVNTAGSAVFQNAIFAMERLGRAMAGFRTNPAPPAAPDGSGTAFTFPQDFQQQTQDIQASLDLIETARQQDVMTERVNLGGRLTRVQTAKSILDLTKTNTTTVLSSLQDADITESATKLTQAQTALQASLQITGTLLNQSILNFL